MADSPWKSLSCKLLVCFGQCIQNSQAQFLLNQNSPIKPTHFFLKGVHVVSSHFTGIQRCQFVNIFSFCSYIEIIWHSCHVEFAKHAVVPQKRCRAMPWLIKWLVTELSPQRLGFDPRPVHVVFVVDKVTLGRDLCQVHQFPSVTSTLPMFHTCSFICHGRCITNSMEPNRASASQAIPHIVWNLRFIITFTSACHLSLSWARSIHSMPPHPTSWRFILIYSSYLWLGVPSDLLPRSLSTKTLYAPLLSPIHASCPAHLMNQVAFGEDCRL